MRYKILIGFLCCILAVSVFGGIVAASDWSQMHYDASHTGYTTDAGPITNNVLWSYNTSLAVTSSVAESGGYVYVPSGANLLCLNVQTGALVWNYTSPDFGKVWGAAIANGYVYTGTDGYHIYCLNATTGTQVWNYTTAGTDYTTTVSGSYIYAGSGHNVYCLNAQTGASVWNYTTGGGAYVPSVSGSYVYVGSDDGKVYCLNAQTGASVWNYTTGDSIYSTPAVSGGYVYVGSIDHNVYCLNAQTGEKVWNYTADSLVFSGPAVAKGYVYVGSYSGNFYCLNAQNGNLVWNYTTGIGSQDHAILCSAAVSGNGYVYFGSDDYSIYCLNANTGALVWSYATLSYVTSGPSVVDGFLFIGSNDGRVFAFGTLQNAALSIQDSAPSVTVGSNLTVSGSLTPANSGTVTIWESINGSAFTMLNEATLTNGGYSYKFNPSAVGSYQFYASWPGNFPYNPANSSTITVSVSQTPPTPTTITCIANPSQIVEGNTTTVSGSISPALSGKTVTLTYTKPGGATLVRTATTSQSGAYSDLYQPDTIGSWSVVASWAGDSTHSGATSTVAAFTVTNVTTQPGSKCFIATATFGSEAAPQVQALRDFRETIALKTFAGTSFMTVFNSWYYSWSPPVAAQIAPDPSLRSVMTVVLQPILYILPVATATFSALSFNGELAIVMAGLVAAALIGLVYIAPAVTLAFLTAKRLKRNLILPSASLSLRYTSIPWLISIALIIIAELALAPVLMMIATAAFVILTIFLTVGTTSLWLASLYKSD